MGSGTIDYSGQDVLILGKWCRPVQHSAATLPPPHLASLAHTFPHPHARLCVFAQYLTTRRCCVLFCKRAGGGDGGILREILKENPKMVTMVEIDQVVYPHRVCLCPCVCASVKGSGS